MVFVVCCLLPVDCCSSRVVRRASCADSCALVVGCWVLVVGCARVVVCCLFLLLIVVCCVLFVFLMFVWCLQFGCMFVFVVCCLLSVVWCLLYVVRVFSWLVIGCRLLVADC